MKKLFILLALLSVAILCLSGCESKKYEDSEAEQVAAKGREMMEAWLKENMPDAEVEKCEAYIDYAPGSGQYLTDYAWGTIVQDGEKTTFGINTLNGAVYFDHRRKELDEEAAAFLFDTMGVTPENVNFTCYVIVPANDGGSERKTFNKYIGFGIPAGTEDMRDFVRNPGSRPQLQVSTNFTVADDVDIFQYDLAAVQKLGEDCGMYFQNLDFANTDQKFNSLWTRETSVYQQGWFEKEGLRLRGTVRYREDEQNSRTKEITGSDQVMDPEKDLLFEKTENGFRYSFADPEWKLGFYIYADADSEYTAHDYLFLQDEEGQVGRKDEKDIEKQKVPMTWKEQEDGSFVMVEATHGTIPLFTGSGTLEEKE